MSGILSECASVDNELSKYLKYSLTQLACNSMNCSDVSTSRTVLDIFVYRITLWYCTRNMKKAVDELEMEFNIVEF